MAYIFETTEESGIFVARVGGTRYARGADNNRALWEFWTSVAADMKQRGSHSLLAVLSVQGSPRSFDIRMFYRRLGELGFMANMRLAFVLDVAAIDRPAQELGVEAAAQDGWTIRSFLTESHARAWLGHRPPQAASESSKT